MSTALRITVLSSILALALGCVDPPLVVQGPVLAYDEHTNTITICDDLPPNPELILSLEGAEVGKAPSLGDVVRVAYRDKGGVLKALRLQNLTRQEELQGKKH